MLIDSHSTIASFFHVHKITHKLQIALFLFSIHIIFVSLFILHHLKTLSDELIKTDQVIESIVRKVENTGVELSHYTGKKSELTVGGG